MDQSKIEFDEPGQEKAPKDRSKLAKALVEKFKVRRGCVYQAGLSRIMCGDATSSADVQTLMQGARADLLFTSPPYWKQRSYKMQEDFDWDELMNSVFAQAPMHQSAQILVNLGLIHKNNQWHSYWDAWVERMKAMGWRPFGWYVWDKLNGFPGDFSGRFAPAFEFIFHFNRQSIRPRKIIATKPGSAERQKSRMKKFMQGPVPAQRLKNGTVRPYSPASIANAGQPFKIPDSVIRMTQELRRGIHTDIHPAVFPVGLPEFFMKCWDGSVYEPFSGSGSSVIAAQRQERSCFAMELEPEYVALSLERFRLEFGATPVCVFE
jgi:DNA modification methylase